MTVRESAARARARTPGTEDYPTSVAAHDRAPLPTHSPRSLRRVRKVDTNQRISRGREVTHAKMIFVAREAALRRAPRTTSFQAERSPQAHLRKTHLSKPSTFLTASMTVVSRCWKQYSFTFSSFFFISSGSMIVLFRLPL